MSSPCFNWKRSLLFHLGITITISISVIEIGLYLSSYEAQKGQLIQLRDDLRQDVLEKSGKDYHELHPDILSDIDIESRMKKYRGNFVILLLLTISFVVAITMIVYHMFVGRHITKLRALIKKTDGKQLHYFPEEEIPPNDLGDVIRDRNEQMSQIEAYNHDLEGKVKDAEESLVHAAKLSALGEFTSTLAHDLNNPLAVIMGNVEFLKEPVRSLNDEKAFRRLKKIHMASERIGKLIKRMGSQSRSEFSIREKVDLAHVLDNALVMLESKTKRSMVDVVNVLSNDARLVKADDGAIEQVLMNLISNACDALMSVEDARVIVESRRLEDFVEIRVRDNGPGIPEDIKDSVFSSFVTTKAKGKGTGLGLSICQQIMDLHGGSIELGDNDSGAEFVLRLPAS